MNETKSTRPELEKIAADLKTAMHTEAGKTLWTGLDAYTNDPEDMLAAMDDIDGYAHIEGLKLDEDEDEAFTVAYRAALYCERLV
jgi:hypothetical protein